MGTAMLWVRTVLDPSLIIGLTVQHGQDHQGAPSTESRVSPLHPGMTEALEHRCNTLPVVRRGIK
eukprot:6476824-Amphidinium_carterae.1